MAASMKLLPFSMSVDLQQPAPYIDGALSRQLVFNQLAVGYTVWTGGYGAQILSNQVHLDRPATWLIGTLSALPLLAVNRAIEKSDAPIFTGLNLSTNSIVQRLFGEIRQPVFALAASIFLALLTGVCEEIVFRGGVLAGGAQYAVDHGNAATLPEGVPFGVASSTFFFAVGHLPFFGGLANFFSLDTAVLFGLQLFTGGSFALIFLLTGDLTAAIVAHFLYDLYILYETHLVVTDQIAYSKAPLPPLPQQSLTAMRWRMVKGKEFVDEARSAFLLMDTNRDEQISEVELRTGLYSMGLKLDSNKLRSNFALADTDQSGDIDFDEFLEFVGSAKSEASQAIKGSLLGVRA
jgi:membrane protease YdiL (CAAX protease family)